MEFIPFEKIKKEWMKDPEFRKIHEEMKPGFEFASMLISKRLEKNMTQEELAKKLGIDPCGVLHMESGDYNPSLKELSKIAKAFESELEITLK